MGSQFNHHPGVLHWTGGCQSITLSTPCLTSSFELQQCHLSFIVHWREQQSEKTIKICQPFPLMTLPPLCRAAHYSASFAAMRPRKDPGNSTLPPNPFWKGSGRVKMTDLGVFDRTRCFVRNLPESGSPVLVADGFSFIVVVRFLRCKVRTSLHYFDCRDCRVGSSPTAFVKRSKRQRRLSVL